MKSIQSIYETLIEKLKKESRNEVLTRVVYDPSTGIKTTYYNNQPVLKEIYKVDVRWKDASTKS